LIAAPTATRRRVECRNEKRALYGLRDVQVKKAALPLGHRCLWVPLPLGAATTRSLAAASWRRYHGGLIFLPRWWKKSHASMKVAGYFRAIE
jgi:hypothetical protein